MTAIDSTPAPAIRFQALVATLLGAAAGLAGLWRARFLPAGGFDGFAFQGLGSTGQRVLTAVLYAVALLALVGAALAFPRPRMSANLTSLAAGLWLLFGIVLGQEATWLTLGPIAAAAISGLFADAAGLRREGGPAIHRHAGLVRVTHWVNVVCIFFLLVSGMQIFNAHPALDFGNRSDFERPALEMTAANTPSGPVGITRVFGKDFATTGVLGLSSDLFYGIAPRGFPSWLTLPSYGDLATGRRWHFFFAWILVINGLAYLIFSLASRHLQRDLLPTGRQLAGLGRSIFDHLRGRFHDEDARRYNVLQKLAYVGLILVLLLLIFAGLTMSPGFDALFPQALDILGGRQGARTVHFICAALVVLFIFVHVGMVLISGVWNNLRSMITGRYVLPKESADASDVKTL